MSEVAKQPHPFLDIFAEFVDNAAFLWVLRHRQSQEPHVFPEHIRDLDERIQANLDGILVSLDDAWDLITQAADQFPQGGEAFVMAASAFASGDVAKIQQATEFGLSSPETFKGITSALAWLPGAKIHPWLKQFLASKNLDHKYLAIAACCLRREDPALYLTQMIQRDDCRAQVNLYARCLRAIGEFNRQDLAAELLPALNHEDAGIKFWALFSSALLGKLANAELFKPYILAENPWREKALPIALRCAPLTLARQWIGELVEAGELRTAIRACGFLGDPLALEWLVGQMANPELARIAAEAFYLITGLVYASETPGELHTQDDEFTAAMLYDENIPWPNPAGLSASLAQGQWTPGERYFIGSTNPAAPQGLAQRYARLQQQLKLLR